MFYCIMNIHPPVEMSMASQNDRPLRIAHNEGSWNNIMPPDWSGIVRYVLLAYNDTTLVFLPSGHRAHWFVIPENPRQLTSAGHVGPVLVRSKTLGPRPKGQKGRSFVAARQLRLRGLH